MDDDPRAQAIGRPVGVGARFGAGLIDLGVFLALAVALKVATGGGLLSTTTQRNPQTGVTATYYAVSINLSGWLALLYLALLAAYYIGMEARFGGTLGKLARGLRVVRVDGRPMTWRTAATRTVWRLADGFPYILPYLSGALHVLLTARKQRMGDRAAGTIVVRTDDR